MRLHLMAREFLSGLKAANFLFLYCITPWECLMVEKFNVRAMIRVRDTDKMMPVV